MNTTPADWISRLSKHFRADHRLVCAVVRAGETGAGPAKRRPPRKTDNGSARRPVRARRPHGNVGMSLRNIAPVLQHGSAHGKRQQQEGWEQARYIGWLCIQPHIDTKRRIKITDLG